MTDEFSVNVNRFKKLPAIVDNGFQLSESIAILRYLANRNKIADHWYPQDDQKRARIDEYLEWYHLNTRLFCAKYVLVKFIKPFITGSNPNERQVILAEKHLNQNLDLFEDIWLKSGFFLSGCNEISFADLLAACEIEQLSEFS